MKTKDSLILESLYEKVLLRENEEMENLAKDAMQPDPEDDTKQEDVSEQPEAQEGDAEKIAAIERFVKGQATEEDKKLIGLTNDAKPTSSDSTATSTEEEDNIPMEKIRHGIQKVIEEKSKKKVNPWAVCGKIKGDEKKERCVKGVKKSAKKYHRKITSKKVK